MDQSGVSVDPAKVEVISNMLTEALMDEDGCTVSVRKIKSFLGMFLFSIRASFLDAQPLSSLRLH